MLIDEFAEDKMDLLKFIQAAKERGINIDYASLQILSRSHSNIENYLVPESIPNFIISILKDIHPRKIYDPWANIGSLLSPLVNRFKPKEGALGINPDEPSYKITQLLSKNKNIEWLLTDPQDFRDNSFDLIASYPKPKPFDLIVSAPQFRDKENLPLYFGESDTLDDDIDEIGDDLLIHRFFTTLDQFVFENIELLGNDGVGAFVVSSFFFSNNEISQTLKNKWKENAQDWIVNGKNIAVELLDLTSSSILKSHKNMAERSDCYIDAAFLLPQGIFAPLKSIPLAIVKREDYK